MTDKEAMAMALEALEYIDDGANNQGAHIGISWRCVSTKAKPAITALKARLAQDKALQALHSENERLGLYKDVYTEPVAQYSDIVSDGGLDPRNKFDAPPKRIEPICPECKAEVLYECVACSSNNYPPPQRTEQEPCVHAKNPKGCYRVRCQVGDKCVDDEMSFRTTPPQPEQEPVAFASHGVINWIADKQFQHEADLYTTPPQRKPLTDEQIYDMYNEPRSDAEMIAFARAIEAAHGIKENT